MLRRRRRRAPERRRGGALASARPCGVTLESAARLSVVHRLELLLVHAALGADPVVRQVVERRARLDAVVRVADLGIVDVAADGAHVLHARPPRSRNRVLSAVRRRAGGAVKPTVASGLRGMPTPRDTLRRRAGHRETKRSNMTTPHDHPRDWWQRPGLEARPLPPVAGMVVRGGHVAPFRLAVPCAPPQSVSRRGHSAQAGCYSGFDGAARAAAHCTENAVPRARRPSMKYVCTVCGYVYDPEVGDPDNGVEPGTAFDDLPDDWVCPECGVDKEEFEPVDD